MPSSRPVGLTALLALVVACPAFAFGTTVIAVSPSGRDDAPGTPEAPVASVARAAERVRALRVSRPSDPVSVVFAPGEYPVLETLKLGPADSGTAAAPVTWRAREPGTVRLTGARPIEGNRLRLVDDPALLARLPDEAQGKVWELALAGSQVKAPSRLPDYTRDAFDLPEVYFDGTRLPLARWPNGTYGYTTLGRVLSSGPFEPGKPEGGVFVYRGDRPARWTAAAAEGSLWLRGFWRVPWVAEILRVRAVDASAGTIAFAVSTGQGIGSKYSATVPTGRAGDGTEPWHAVNLFDEIDQPGEWTIDLRRGRLFLWPPAPPATGRLAIADNSQPIVAFDDARHLIWRDLVLSHQRGDAVSITGGEEVRLLGCRIENVGRRGVVVRGGLRHEVRSCDLTEIGLSAIDVLGGDRATLTPSGHQIVNNHIHRVALAGPVAAVVAGLDARRQQVVGVRIAHNRIHDATYGGVTFAGNDNLLEWNEVYRIGLDGGDLGAFYTTGGWTSRGNVVRHNFIHHAENGNGIYMDDGSSGLRVEGNLIYRVESGIFIGGGHDHDVRGNIVVASGRAFHVDDRGVARKYVADDPRLRGDLDSVPYRGPRWAERYPELTQILDADPAVPRGNRFLGNAVVACGAMVRRSGKPATLVGFTFSDTLQIPDTSVFTAPTALDFRPRDTVAAARLGPFAPAPLDRYGLQPDEFRPTVPPRDLELLRSGDTRRRRFDSETDVQGRRP